MRCNTITSIGLFVFAVLPACGQGPAGLPEDESTSQQELTDEPDPVASSSVAKPSAADAVDAARPATDAELARIKDYLDGQYTAKDTRHSFQTKFGETIDCVDFFRHPGVRALAARGTRVSEIPAPPPPPDLPPTTKPVGDPSDDSFNGLPDSQGRPRSCPRGTAPVVRVEASSIIAEGGLDRYLANQVRKLAPPDPIGSNGEYHAHVYDRYTDPSANITSGTSTLNVLKPVFSSGASGHNFSLSQTWMSNTAKTQTVEAGWTVAESVNGVGQTDPHLFIYATNDAYTTTGCYNNTPMGTKRCLAWVPSAQSVYAPGMQLSAGAQEELTISTRYRSPSDSPGYTGPAAWWIYVQGSAGGSYIGYYLASEFAGGEMATRGGRYTIGGEVSDSTNTWVVPMGTGASALAGLGQAGYHRNYRACTGGYAGGYTWCTSGGTFPTPTNFDGPQANEFGYDFSTTGGGSGWGPYFFYGNNPAVFWGHDYGTQWSPVGDWNYGNYKAECGLGQPVTGLSQYTYGSHQGHAILCGSKTVSNVTGSGCYLRSFADGDNRAPNTGTGNWERYYYYRGECASNEFVQGISQSTSGQVNGILCCPGTVAHTSCEVQTFYARDSSGYSGVDWDPNYFKGQCPAGKYVAGVSSIKSSRIGVVGAPHGILCCNQ
ncbi:MAG: neprosin family prolyl endopeptidase [Polyangiaceae bacterium]|nr:neprosin family prolyl endopeptidase [Polyangiaceae bacterium]